MRTPRRAFTLLELVAATALSAALLTVTLAVLRTVSRPTRPPAAAPAAGPLAEHLRWDVANAVVLRADRFGLVLGGYGSLDPASMAPTHEPVIVTYGLRTGPGGTWLVRQQQSLASHGDTWAELAAGGVTGLTVDAPPTAADRAAATRPADEDPTPLPFQRLANVRPVPPRVQATVRFADGSATVVEAVR